MDGSIRTAVDRCEATAAPLPWTKCGLSNNGDCTSDTSRQQHTGWNGVNSWMVRYVVFHSHGLIQTAIQGRAVITSLVECVLSLCGVTSRDTGRASRAPFPRPYHNQRVELRLCRQRVKQQHQKKFGLEQHFRAIDFLP